MAPETTISVEEILSQVRPTPLVENEMSQAERVEKIAGKFAEIMEILGLDLSNDSLRETPQRVARMYVEELFSGLWAENFPKVTVIDNEMGYDQMIVSQRVEIKSTCEHHFQTIDGFATIAYIPKDKVVGLSKINRIARYFSRRPQVQERLTKQIADCLSYVLGTDNVAVHISARHYCMAQRGVEDTNSTTVTCDLRGDFKVKPDTRSEFLRHCDTDYFYG
ncbi:MAG: GTP cyclohydrolase I FolE [Bdellovibrionales bacterium]|nr:GTP cyclohydrolase I FolE [Bdellovibrionales bacterium]